MSHESLTAKIARGYDWWFAVRWRVLITWIALATLSSAAFVYRSGDWLNLHIQSLMMMLDKVGVTVRPLMELRIFAFMALVSWYQPVLLRIGSIRTALWIVAYCGLYFATLWCAKALSLSNQLQATLFFGNFCGVAGLLAIGARTRAWMSLVAGALSVAAITLATRTDLLRFGLASTVWIVMLSQAVYAPVMIYGTRRIEKRNN